MATGERAFTREGLAGEEEKPALAAAATERAAAIGRAGERTDRAARRAVVVDARRVDAIWEMVGEERGVGGGEERDGGRRDAEWPWGSDGRMLLCPLHRFFVCASSRTLPRPRALAMPPRSFAPRPVRIQPALSLCETGRAKARLHEEGLLFSSQPDASLSLPSSPSLSPYQAGTDGTDYGFRMTIENREWAMRGDARDTVSSKSAGSVSPPLPLSLSQNARSLLFFNPLQATSPSPPSDLRAQIEESATETPICARKSRVGIRPR